MIAGPVSIGAQATVHSVLVVDDSAFMRRMIAEMIDAEPGFTVAGFARDGVDAMEQVGRLDPDIVTLDLEMPRLDGLRVLRRIMAESQRAVVVLSAGGAQYGDATLRALELGAVDFVRKPSGPVSLDLPVVRERLVQALRAAARATLTPSPPQPPTSSLPSLPSLSSLSSSMPLSEGKQASEPAADGEPRELERTASRARATKTAGLQRNAARHVVVIASSTGGPRALAEVVPLIPAALGAAVVIAQHLPGEFTTALVNRLASASRIAVREAEDGATLLAGTVYIARGGGNTRITGMAGTATLERCEAGSRGGATPSADVLFESAAAVFGAACTGVILTGMGRDGATGLRSIRSAGGRAIVQDEASSAIYGMPRAALAEAGADSVVSLSMVAGAITETVPEERIEWLTV